MKELRTVQTEIGELSIPRSLKQVIRIKKGADLGSNLMEGWNEDIGFGDGYLGHKFNGYESQGRKPFTRKEVEDFILLCSKHRRMQERFAHLLIIIMGQYEA